MSGACVAEAPSASSVGRPMETTLSVKRGFAWTITGYAVYMLCLWGMIVALTRWGTEAQLSQFAIALATTTPIILFSNLGLRRVYASDANSTFRFADYVGLRMATNVAGLAIVALVVWTAGFPADLAAVTLAMGAAKTVESVTDILHGYFQVRGRIDLGARSTLLRGPLSLAGFVTGLLATRDVLWAVVGMGAAWTAVLLLYDWPRSAHLRGSTREGERPMGEPGSGRAESCLRLAGVALPLGLVALVTSLKASIPTFVIAGHLGDAALALFTALIYFNYATNRVVSALGEAATARLAVHYAKGNGPETLRLLKHMLGFSLAISAAGLAVSLLAGGLLLNLFYGARYAGAGAILAAIMAAAVVTNLQTVFDYGMTATRQLRLQPWMYAAGTLLLFALCLVLVPVGGLQGAALALGIASGAELLASGAVVGWALSRRGSSRSRPVLEGP